MWALDPERMCNRFSLHVQNDNRLATPQEIAANAQLAAAAPGLAEALSRLIRTGYDCQRHPTLPSSWEAWEVSCELAREALHKAGAPNA